MLVVMGLEGPRELAMMCLFLGTVADFGGAGSPLVWSEVFAAVDFAAADVVGDDHGSMKTVGAKQNHRPRTAPR